MVLAKLRVLSATTLIRSGVIILISAHEKKVQTEIKTKYFRYLEMSGSR